MKTETYQAELVSAEGELEKILKSEDILSVEITFTYKDNK